MRWQLAAVCAAAGSAVVGFSCSHRTAAAEESLQSGTAAVRPRDLHLKQVQVVFRHGARAPLTQQYIDGYLWDDCKGYADVVPVLLQSPSGGPKPTSRSDVKQVSIILPGGCHKGQLTTLGQQQAFEFGRWLRTRYVDTHMFLPGSYQDGALSATSTNWQRTIATLQGVVTGLYPEPTTPVRLIVNDELEEYLYTNVSNCEALADIVRAAKQRVVETASRDRSALSAKFREILHIPASEHINYTELHDVLTCIRFHGKALHAGISEDMLQQVNELATQRTLLTVAPTSDSDHHPHLLRLGLGHMLEVLVQNMDRVQKGSDGGRPRLFLYSGHDTTIMPLIIALGLTLEQWPPYLSHIIYEVWEGVPEGSKGPEQYVRVLYNDIELQIPGVAPGALCTVAMFKDKVVAPYRISKAQHQLECKGKWSHDSSAPQPTSVTEQVAVDGSAAQGF